MFDINLIDWTEDQLWFQCDFSQPMAISQGQEPDQVAILIHSFDKFIAKKTLKQLNSDYGMLVGTFPKQVKKGVVIEEVKQQVA